jgi:hypothetical protein
MFGDDGSGVTEWYTTGMGWGMYGYGMSYPDYSNDNAPIYGV